MSKHSKKLVPIKAVLAQGENDVVKPFSSSSKGNLNRGAKNLDVITKKPSVPAVASKSVIDKSIQTDHPDVSLVTGEEPPLEYWKLLAEKTIKENEDLKTENTTLKRKLELADSEIETLEEMLKDAKKMAQYIESLPGGDEEEEEEDKEDDDD